MEVAKTWTNKTEGYMSSPKATKVSYIERDKRFHCFEAKSGKLMWSSEDKHTEYASMVAKGDTALALKADGELLMISLTPKEFKIIDTKKVSDQSTWAILALCGDEVFVRVQRYFWELNGLNKVKDSTLYPLQPPQKPMKQSIYQQYFPSV